ncbi:MAG: Ig-like domain-containing protein [Lachnospiraceae bacterium]|nr:Ig-like domain-containing protein [Lachnospiraceae bacterium]
MRGKGKRALSLLLSVAMVVTGLTIVPKSSVLETQAQYDGAIVSNMDSTSGAEVTHYWRGEEFELSCKSNGTVTVSSVSVTKNGSDALSQFTIGDVTSEQVNATYKEYKIKVTVKEDAASGSYVFSVNDGSSTVQAQIPVFVHEEDVYQSYSAVNNQFFNSRKSFQEVFVYNRAAYDKAVAAGKEIKFSFDESLSQDYKVETSQADLSTNKGCATYTVTITPLRYMYTENGVEKPIINSDTATQNINLKVEYYDRNEQSQTKNVPYVVKQSFISMDELELSKCSNFDLYAAAAGINSMDAYVSAYPHKDGNMLYLDANETVYFRTVLRGSLAGVDGIGATVTGLDTYFNSTKEDREAYSSDGFEYKTGIIYDSTKSEEFADQNVQPIIIKLTTNDGVTTTSPVNFTLTPNSGNASKTYQFVIYNTIVDENHKPSVQYEVGGEYGTSKALTYDRFGGQSSYEFKTLLVDSKDYIIWQTSAPGTAYFSGGSAYDGDTAVRRIVQSTNAVLTTRDAGQLTVTAMTDETKTRPKGAVYLPGSLRIEELILPDEGKLKLTYNSLEQSADSLKVGDKKKYSYSGMGTDQNGNPAQTNYQGFVWHSDDETVATVDENGLVETHKQGKTKIYLTTNYPSVYRKADVKSNEMELSVYDPIKSLDIKDESGKTWGGQTIAVVEDREYVLTGDKPGSTTDKSTEPIKWSVNDTTYAAIKKSDGTYAVANEEVQGDECTLVIKELPEGTTDPQPVNLTCTAVQTTGVAATAALNIYPKLAAKSVVIDYTGTSIRQIVGYQDAESQTGYAISAKQYYDDGKTVASNEKLTWISGDDSIVKAVPQDVNGSVVRLQFVGVGETTVTVRSESGVTDTVRVAGIKKAEYVSLQSSGTYGELAIGDPVTLTASLTPTDATDPIEWSASPADAVTFTEASGHTVKVTVNPSAQLGSQVTITATATDSGAHNTPEPYTIKQSVSAIQAVGLKASYTYTGEMIDPTAEAGFALVVNGKPLTPGTDYSLYITDNQNVGTAKINITGMGNYTGTKTIEFRIVPADLSQAAVTVNNGNEMTYTGEEVKPELVVMLGTRNLYVESDFTVTYSNNIKAGTATATVLIKGIGNYTGTINQPFTILAKSVNDLYPSFEDGTNFEYTGSAIKPKLVIADGTATLKEGVDYTVAYTNNTNVSTDKSASVKITGIGNYKDTREDLFTITAQTLTNDSIKLSKTDYVYNGKKCKPTVTVYNSAGKKLKAKKDYTVTYPDDMVEMGVKTIVIEGKGNFTGTVYAEYGIAEKVTVKKATIKSAKNSKSKKVVVQLKKVSGADGYEITYSTSKKFTKDTTKTITTTKTKATLSKLKKGKTYYIKVRAYKNNSIGRMIFGKASKTKSVKIKK